MKRFLKLNGLFFQTLYKCGEDAHFHRRRK